MLELVGERYEVLRRIGAGGMGVVYEVMDAERSQRLALKTITNPNIEKVFQLKREFRALADLSHPNLVALYDLVVDVERCFFTMELLDGHDLLAYLWGKPSTDELALAMTTTRAPGTVESITNPLLHNGNSNSNGYGHSGGHDETAPFIELGAMVNTPCLIDRLRNALPQLVHGLNALHAARKVHRDVKPSNILVTAEGRVVLVDFGLVAEMERGHIADEGKIVGTVAYMAPEQCAGDPHPTAAVDWYALGAVLFHVLTGRLPFEGPSARVVLEKQTVKAPRPSQLARGIPADLDQLCADLLEREPADRPTGAAMLQRLGLRSDSGRMPVVSVSRDGAFAGREPELTLLKSALVPLTKGRASVAVVRAPSGLGKTALVARFFEQVRATHAEALLLRGRCLDREDIPYKAIDLLIDELSEWWLDLHAKDAEALLPADACLLPTLFPVLDRVPAIANAPRTRQLADPQVRRTHAFNALRDTLQRLGESRTVVLFLDDMQWVDRDTTTLLADLMRAPDPPPILLVLASRVENSELVLDLVRRMDVEPILIDVGPLSPEAATSLALAQLGDTASPETVARVVREADGSPLFLMELVRYLQAGTTESGDRNLDAIAGRGLDAMLAERIDALGQSARLLAEVVAVSGEPLGLKMLALATGLEGDTSRQVSLLRAQRVVRMSGTSEDGVEVFHARVREALLSGMPPERRVRHHRALATAWAGHRGTAEQLARHWYSAGDLEHAVGHARRAGDEAAAKLDFDLTARWYAIALQSERWTDQERRDLRTQLGDALANAGRPREAADSFLSATEGADSATGLELRRRASASLLQSGYVEEGLALTKAVLSAVGLHMAKSPLRALVSMLLRRAWLRVRGLGFSPRPLAQISQTELTRVDVCEGVSFGLALVDTFRSMDFATRFLSSALRLGEPWRVSRALALETDFLAATAKTSRSLRLLDRLDQLTATLENPAARSQLTTTRAFIEFFVYNRFRAALDQFTDAIASYRAVVGRAGFELDTVSMFCCWSLYYMGDIGELSRRVPAMVEAAMRNGNRYTAVTLRCAFPMAWLARMAPDTIETEIEAALASWASPDQSYQLQHMLALCSRVDLALYRGRPEDVSERIATEWPALKRALLDRPPIQALLLRSTFARQALACATTAASSSLRRRNALSSAAEHIRKLRAMEMPLGKHCANMFDGVIAQIAGRKEDAMALYERAIAGFEQCDTKLFANAVRFRQGALMGGFQGNSLSAQARNWLGGHQVREPDAILDMLLPGPA
jgi:eukaryotic-like serine/threonine-protein kinase